MHAHTYLICMEVLAANGAAGENFGGFRGREGKFTGLQAPQAKVLRFFAAAKENFAFFCGREGKFCGFHGLHYLLRMQLPTPGG